MITRLLVSLVDVYTFIILIYCILSWIPSKRGWLADIDRTLAILCEPYLGFFRRLIPSGAGLDFSPIVAIFALQILVRLIYFIL